MKIIIQVYQFIQFVSLDVVAGAITMTFLFSRLYHVFLSTEIYFVLAICVWLIYTIDHLLDAKNIKGSANTRRHRFHQLYFIPLVYLSSILLVVGFLLSLVFVPLVTWRWGLVLTLFSLLHFILVHFFGSNKSKLVFKELGVAFGYTCGVLIAPISLCSRFEWYYGLSAGLLFLVVLFNLIMFSYFDYHKDIKNQQTSFVVNYGLRCSRFILYSLFALITIVSAYALVIGDWLEFYYLFSILLLFFIGLGYMLMVVFMDASDSSDRFRKVGDAVFIFPVVILFLEKLFVL